MTVACRPITERPIEAEDWWRYSRKGISETVSQLHTHEHQYRDTTPPQPRIDLANSHILKDLSVQPWFIEIATRLQRFLAYEANWNGYGEQPISRQAVKHALVLLHRVALGGPEPVVVPVCDGGIQIEWYYSGTEIEVEISPHGAELIYIARPDGTCVEHDPQQMDQDIWDKLRAVVAELKADGVG